MRKEWARRAASALTLVLASCSLTTDFGAFDRETGTPPPGDGGTLEDGGAATVDGAPLDDAGAESPTWRCSDDDPARIFCSAFDGPSAAFGFLKAVSSGDDEYAALDRSRSLTPPASSIFLVRSARDRYALLIARSGARTSDVVETFASFYLPDNAARLTLLQLSGNDGTDSVVLRATPAGAELVHASARVPLNAPLPRNRFFHVLIHRDDRERTAIAYVDGRRAVSEALRLDGPGPADATVETRVGIVYAQDADPRVELWADDVGIRSPR